jgi:predicted nucleic acid-binding protein
MNGKTDASMSGRIYIDTNILIVAFEGQGVLRDLTAQLLVSTPIGERPRLVTSEFTLSELLVKPYELKRDDLITLYDNWILTNDYLEVVPVVRDVLKDAAQLRARDKGLKLPDAIHLTTAIGTGCKYFLTGDRRISGQFGVEIVHPAEDVLRVLIDVGMRK